MHAFTIVEAFDPVDDVEPRMRARVVAHAMNPHDLQRLEEAFDHRVCPPAAASAHRLNHSIVVNESPMRFACILTARVGVHDQSRRWLAVPNSKCYRLQD